MKRPVIFIIGVTGSGKTTIGKLVASQTAISFFDADAYHPEANIEKMKSGHPLTDEDRLPWLVRLNQLALSSANKEGAVIACSALKESYRQILSAGLTNWVSTWIVIFWGK